MYTQALKGSEGEGRVVEDAAREARFQARIEKGIEEGDVPAGVDTLNIARFLQATIQGLSIQARDGASAEELRIMAQTALAALPAEGQNRDASSKE